jgi:hypothetical protein
MNFGRVLAATTAKPDKRGLTAVELAIAVAILTFLVTLTLLLLRRQRQDELQARADAAPADIFKITLAPERDSYTAREPVAFLCDVCNPTDFALDFTWDDWLLSYLSSRPVPDQPETILHGGQRSILEWSADSGWTDPIPVKEPFPSYRIHAGDTLRFKFQFAGSRVEGPALPPEGVGVTAWLHRPSTWRVGDPLVENTMILTRFTLLPNAEAEEPEPDKS